jgi:tripartite-type tricarboxylate transporter receptor subunit TctC
MERSAVDAMYQAVLKAVSDPELMGKLQDMAIFAQPAGPDAYRSQLLKDAEFWTKVVRSAKIVPQ